MAQRFKNYVVFPGGTSYTGHLLFSSEKNGLWSFPLSGEQLCCLVGGLLGKQTSSAKAERHHTTCKQRYRFGDVVLTTLVPQAS